MKSYLIPQLLLAFWLLSSSTIAQSSSYFGRQFTAGTSLTYIRHDDNNNYFEPAHEFTWNLNGAISLTKQARLGIQALTIYANSSRNDFNFYNLVGVFAQYHFLQLEKLSFFGEASYNQGDFCTCNDEQFAYRRDGLNYLGMGGGVEFLLPFKSKRFFLDASFIHYLITNPIESKYGYNQYVLGLNYKIGKL